MKSLITEKPRTLTLGSLDRVPALVQQSPDVPRRGQLTFNVAGRSLKTSVRANFKYAYARRDASSLSRYVTIA